jgi:tetratricopeptide (TPR) repeat protein
MFLIGWSAWAASGWDEHFSRGEESQRNGRYEQAAAEFEAALQELRGDAARRENPVDVRGAVTWNNLGVVYSALGRTHEAESSYLRAIAFYENRPQFLSALAAPLDNLASLYLALGRVSKAEPLYRRCYEIRLRILPPNDPALGHSLHGLARLEHERRRPDRAEGFYRQALAIEESAYGVESLEVAPTLHNLATLLAETSRADEARAFYNRALAIYRSHRPGHPAEAVILRHLAELDAKAGSLALAESRFLQALAICESTLPPDHPQTGIILQAYGQLLRQARRKSESNKVIARANLILVKGLRESGAGYTVEASMLSAK